MKEETEGSRREGSGRGHKKSKMSYIHVLISHSECTHNLLQNVTKIWKKKEERKNSVRYFTTCHSEMNHFVNCEKESLSEYIAIFIKE